MNEATRAFIREHAADDVRQLALRFAARHSGAKRADGDASEAVDLALALDQIRGRQVARRKLPSWAAQDGIVYPPHLSMEQCSSEPTARYKARLLARLLGNEEPGRVGEGATLIDLTGGFGVDFAFMARQARQAVYVERSEQLCAVARHNFVVLGLEHVEVVCGEAEEFATTPNPSSPEEGTRKGAPNNMEDTFAKGQSIASSPVVYFLDPARRDEHGGRTYGLADCTPNVLLLRDQLLKNAEYIVLKLSPMLDWRAARSELGARQVSEVHVVSVDNECKELLLVMRKNTDETALFCTNLPSSEDAWSEQQFALERIDEAVAPVENAEPEVGQYLYEPNASLMKAGCFAALSRRYGVAPLARDSHLFLSTQFLPDFPGRKFQISAVSSMNKGDFRVIQRSLSQANVATRNFPMKPEELRRRLKLRDGGDDYLFGTTLASGRHVLILCAKAG